MWKRTDVLRLGRVPTRPRHELEQSPSDSSTLLADRRDDSASMLKIPSGIGGAAVDPVDAGVAAEPSVLPAGELTGSHDRLLLRLGGGQLPVEMADRKSTRLNSSHVSMSDAV